MFVPSTTINLLPCKIYIQKKRTTKFVHTLNILLIKVHTLNTFTLFYCIYESFNSKASLFFTTFKKQVYMVLEHPNSSLYFTLKWSNEHKIKTLLYKWSNGVIFYFCSLLHFRLKYRVKLEMSLICIHIFELIGYCYSISFFTIEIGCNFFIFTLIHLL